MAVHLSRGFLLIEAMPANCQLRLIETPDASLCTPVIAEESIDVYIADGVSLPMQRGTPYEHGKRSEP